MAYQTDLRHHHALVTGGGSGIGRAIAGRLNDAGARVSIAGRRLRLLQDVQRELGLQGDCFALDVSDETAVKDLATEISDRGDRVTLLLNNAGFVKSAAFAKTSSEALREHLAVNLNGVFYCCQAFLPAMLEQDGPCRIVNIVSTAGLKAYAYVSAYVTAKHAVIGLTRALALETVRSQVTVNAVCPGFTDTELLRRSVREVQQKTTQSESQILQSFTRNNPQQRLVSAMEVAQSVLWLVADESSAITGQSIVVAGGEIM